ncbi:DUF6630 family protein [Stratiformator vulcanicus]|uniref:DUF6630 domain-containing protein n=1 Tax=Stratiformator vulcanicus TaxID=2527980 RepID=A0A517R569_9PLAN|nr:hypothetical protein [Stratiformator vulcanicus]QDT39035.1 hypothetical protein Pan189_34360 [Stratiformator vulcanicus]
MKFLRGIFRVTQKNKSLSVPLLEDLFFRDPSQPRINLQAKSVRESIAALDSGTAIEWLETRISSPITREWGEALYLLNPDWVDIDRWLRRSKLHALAAADALLFYARQYSSVDGREPHLPVGAAPSTINETLNVVLVHYGNPRLRDAAMRIRHVWPEGTPVRHTVEIPAFLDSAAQSIFESRSELVEEWRVKMVTGIEPPTSVNQMWSLLLEVAAEHEIVAIVDWSEFPELIVGEICSIRSADMFSLNWQDYANHHGDIRELFERIGADCKQEGRLLVSLNTGGDEFALIYLAPKDSDELESLLNSVLDDRPTVERFGV